ncbi:hypothetical protein BU14_1058s0001 [Porphyra umbilicalis]|uniref:FAD dependent oxidoreductase domain-containing protein n=1 Tax=Porphyra umbilicalis TaxID=2786 RepID=A0A1X6NMZ8_PORUM|nr:hypothetical protein BU14_1058s0001 [Porphyra umbilicalis]|eukprot:OSX69856.1 hypothetical protein BU14_1058s0001 [Porphyra umbilicalis]
MGAATAYYLSRRGVTATVVDRAGVAAAASGKAGGFLAADWSDPPVAGLAAASFALHAELAATLGAAAVDYRRLSATAVGLSPSAAATARADATDGGRGRRRGRRRRGAPPSPPPPLPPRHAPSWLDGDAWAVVSARPLGTPATTAQVHPAKLTRALLAASGATLTRAAVTGVATAADGSVTGVLLDGGAETLPCGRLVIATGPWADRAVAWLPAAGLPPVWGTKAHSVVYPRPGGEVYVCGFAEPPAAVPDDPAAVVPTAGACERLVAFAGELTGRLRSGGGGDSDSAGGDGDGDGDGGDSDGDGDGQGPAGGGVAPPPPPPPPVHQACCLPVSPDGVPLIGWLPGTGDTVAITTGHSCWGILLGPASGLAVAQLIVDGVAAVVDLTPFSPSRFCS